jgi:5-methylthioadenosine/S-adenosylhomocysteine deaminase
MDSQVRTVLRGGAVLRPDGSLLECDVHIEGNRIAAMSSSVEPLPADVVVLDITGQWIVPGLVNAHVHAHNNLLRGTGDCRWRESHVNAMAVVFGWQPEDLYISTLLGIAGMAPTGTTAAYDMVKAPSREHLAAVVQAYSDSGLRVTIAPAVSDLSTVDSMPELTDLLSAEMLAALNASPQPSAGACIQFAVDAIAEFDGAADGRVRIAVGPKTADACSDELLRLAGELSREASVGLHAHLLESKLEALNGVRRSGARTWGVHLAELGVLSERSTFAHGVWLTPEDVRIFAEHGVNVVHNPASNLKLGSGLAPVADYLDAGLSVALATDGAASGDSLDMTSAMWLAAIASHVRTPDPRRWLDAPRVLEMATVNGARALGVADLGRLQVGALADLFVLDANQVPLVPANQPLLHLVYGLPTSAVTMTMVDGRVVWDRSSGLRLVDTSTLVDDVRRAAARLGTAAAVTGDRATLEDAMRKLQYELADEPFPVDRHAGG